VAHVDVEEVVAGEEEVGTISADDRRRKAQDGKIDVPGALHEACVDGVVGVEWDPHSEGLKALEEGMGGRMELGVKALLRKLRR